MNKYNGYVAVLVEYSIVNHIEVMCTYTLVRREEQHALEKWIEASEYRYKFLDGTRFIVSTMEL